MSVQQLSPATIAGLSETPTMGERFAWLIAQCGGVVRMGREDDAEACELRLDDSRDANGGRVFRALDKGMGS